MTDPVAAATPDVLPSAGEDIVASAMADVGAIAARRRRRERLEPLDVLSALTLGLGMVAAAVVLAIAGLSELDAANGVVVGLLVLVYAVAYRTEFESAMGGAVPTQPVLVAMLLIAPTLLVPALVVSGLLLGSLGGNEGGPAWHRWAVRSLSGLHCLGPTAVLWFVDPGPPSLDRWPVYTVALVSQFAIDGFVGSLRCRVLGGAPIELVRPMGWTFGVDAMLAPVGLAAVIAADGSAGVFVLLLAPLGLVFLLARDRSEHLEHAVTLGQAFTEAQDEARVDGMTGIGNRRLWDEAVDAAELARREGARVTVVMADLDHLKRTNDNLGHDAGDRLICAAASVLAEIAPPGATVARLGGDEFGILVIGGRRTGDDPDPELGAGLIARIRMACAAPEEHAERIVSISLGTAEANAELSMADAIALADEAASLDKASRRAGRPDEEASRRAGRPDEGSESLSVAPLRH